ncbi:tail fiber domain-containing protein [Hymenobacter monticola]|uniref:Tail fiber domain-containing protein n=1 Tax=Hymenobacter monticola TaxID=1705399 RepID=A0ABY4B4A2_9BACT|nr:tail fiber domain-containing protein [Hymenobacter monticola]UOE32551.1 tail fiber domain-containing protein [Hymenobacter monticola]
MLIISPVARAQTGSVGIGTTAPDASAALDVVSSDKGALLPRLTAAQRLDMGQGTVPSPAPGLLVYQIDAPVTGAAAGSQPGFYYNAGTGAAPKWLRLADSGSALTYAPGTGPQVGTGPVGTAVGVTLLGDRLLSTTFTTPYNSTATGINRRSQYILLASRMQASGLVAGPISSLGFTVTAKNSTGAFAGFTIRLGNTPLSDVPYQGASPGPVVFAGDVTTQLGLNTYPFTTPFVWDGTSNLLVDVCMSNAAAVGVDLVVSTGYTPGGPFVTGFGQGASPCGANITSATNGVPVLFLGQRAAGAYGLPATAGNPGQVLTQQADGQVTFVTPPWTQTGANVLLTGGSGIRVGIGTAAARGALDVAGPGDSYLVGNPANGNSQNLYLPGSLLLAPYSATDATAYVQATVPAPSTASLALQFRTTNNGTLVDALRLNANGSATVRGTVTANGVTLTSDARFKQQVRPLAGSLAAVQQLRGVRYRWNALGVQHGGAAGQEQIGFLAQELEKLYPELVYTDEAGYKSVNYAQLTPVLLEALKELAAKNATLETQVQQQQASLGSFEQRLRALEAGGARAQVSH